jgi:hypothetical protein
MVLPSKASKYLRLLMLLVAGCGATCARHSPGVETVVDSALVVVAGGTDVRRTTEYDGAIYYSVDDPFPASVLQERLGEALANAGWTPSPETLLSLVGQSKAGEWEEYQERDGTRVTQLFRAWKNAGNDLVTFILRYRSAPNESPRHTAMVTGVLTKASTVERLRRESK